MAQCVVFGSANKFCHPPVFIFKLFKLSLYLYIWHSFVLVCNPEKMSPTIYAFLPISSICYDSKELSLNSHPILENSGIFLAFLVFLTPRGYSHKFWYGYARWVLDWKFENSLHVGGFLEIFCHITGLKSILMTFWEYFNEKFVLNMGILKNTHI